MTHYTVGQAHEYGMLTAAEVVFLMTMERKHRVEMPALTDPFALFLDDAVQHCRKEYTMQKMVFGVEPNDQQRALVELTMKLLQAIELMPVQIAMDGDHPVERIIGDSWNEEYFLVMVPSKMKVKEIAALYGRHPDMRTEIVIPTVQYANHGPT